MPLLQLLLLLQQQYVSAPLVASSHLHVLIAALTVLLAMFEGKFIAVLTILNVTFGCVTAATSIFFVASLTSCTGLSHLVHAGGGGGPASEKVVVEDCLYHQLLNLYYLYFKNLLSLFFQSVFLQFYLKMQM